MNLGRADSLLCHRDPVFADPDGRHELEDLKLGFVGRSWDKVDDPGTAIAVAVTAAIGAWAGTKVLDRSAPAPAKAS